MVQTNNGVQNEITGQWEEGFDSLKASEHKIFSNDAYYLRLVREASYYYDQMSELRKKWTRANDYYMGRQLNDKVMYNGSEITVSKLLKIRGLPEFQNDIISDKVLTLKGLLRQEDMSVTVKSTDSNEDDYAAIFSELLRKNDDLNDISEKKAELFEDFVKYGFLAAKVSHSFREGRDDIFVDLLDLYKLAFPAWEKSDLSDVNFIAEAHDMLWADLLEVFGQDENGNASDAALKELQGIYGRQGDRQQSIRRPGMSRENDSDDFLHSSVVGKYRVIEIWKKERNKAIWFHDRANGTCGYRQLADKPYLVAENRSRLNDNVIRDEEGEILLDAEGNVQYYVDPSEVKLIEIKEKIEQFWYYRFLSPNGYLLKEGVSPYRVVRGDSSFYMHPYCFRSYPGKESRSFVDRTIDKQRSANHYLLMYDSILANAAKGAIAYDVASETPEQSRSERIANYNKPNGVVMYDSRKGEKPSALQNTTMPAGLEWMIQKSEGTVVQQSGVQGALQGVHRNTSGRQYAIEKQSASTTVADYFGVFYSFTKQIAKKQLWEIQQFYDENRSVIISGVDKKLYYNPQTMSDVNTDLSCEMDSNSSVMREANNDMLWTLMLQNRIDLPTMLDCGGWTNTAKLKQRVLEYQNQQQQMAAMGAGGMGPNVTAQTASQKAPGSVDNRELGIAPIVGGGTGVQ